ncbi:fibronectin type III domain-containing protein 7-like [Thalassophryne amazonica]|uniref:fibronectin type III domain-containing protein 7-like n=1 Tax=Thalassophryne amazonica TaxID=390379 RepID=UPI0014712FCD|nr:fibronectin type III domain-containing protein 7-like [Thalassophryne amazonica]
MHVRWSSDSSATQYELNFRNLNASVAVISVMQAASIGTERLVQGLRPGHYYEVTLKIVEYLTVVCTNVKISQTVPGRTQFTSSQEISSTSIKIEWASVFGADTYVLFVETSSTVVYNHSFTGLSTQLDGLTPRTSYTCYIYAADSAGWSASSTQKTLTTLVQPPTGVTLVSTGRNTATVSWNPVNNVLSYQVTVSDNDNPNNAPVIKTVLTTTALIDDLEPCSTYTVGVSSLNVFSVPGEPYNVTHTTSTIDPVTAVSQKYHCSIATVAVSWDSVLGATLYKAVAVDSTGMSHNCTTTSNSCNITMLKCGKKYQVQVIAISDDCNSISNDTMVFDTVPCPPADPHVDYSCSSSSIYFNWQHTNNTRFYVARRLDETGHVSECRTLDSTCHFNTDCGHTYNFTVFAVSNECNSDVTQPVSVQTIPCVPENIQTVTHCQDQRLFTSWQSAAGATSYYIELRGNTEEKIYNCTTSNTSCEVTGIPCGEQLSVWAVASNDQCSTEEVFVNVAETVPCTPTNVTAVVDCSQDSARISWIQSKGAIFYTVNSQHADGTIRSCNSMMPTCVIDSLQCGQNYNASVIGTNMMCNSTVSHQVTFKTASCRPEDVVALRNCHNNSVLIMWQNHQPDGVYTATIEDPSGTQFTCTSNTVSNCTINAPPCGKTYNVTVTNTATQCNSTSAVITMDSVPCGPGDVLANVSCSTGELTVTWSNYFSADNYTTVVSRESDPPLYCYSTETTCTLGGLACASTYVVTVFSVSGTCRSLLSAQVIVQSLPCSPSILTSELDCDTGAGQLTWSARSNADNYTVTATSSGGTLLWSSTDTSATLNDLLCGQIYDICVSASNDTCVSNCSVSVVHHSGTNL